MGDVKVEWLKKEVQSAFEQQDKIYKSNEGFRWGRVFKKIEDIGERATMESELSSKKADVTIKV